jgi:hypothetical protein
MAETHAQLSALSQFSEQLASVVEHAARSIVTVAARPRQTRAWRCWGLGRDRHLFGLHVQVRLPTLEDPGPCPVQRPHPRLSQQRRPCFGPRHVRLFAASFAHHFVHCRLHTSRCDRFSVAIARPVMRDHRPVVHDRRAQLQQRLDPSSLPGIGLAARRHRGLQLLARAQRLVDLTMPQ